MDLTQQDDALREAVEEQTALRRVATLVAAGIDEQEMIAAVTSEIAQLFDAQVASILRWEDGTIRVIGEWYESDAQPRSLGRTDVLAGDSLTARIVDAGAPVRIDSFDDLQTELARRLWSELGVKAAIGAPVVVDGELWGIVTSARTTRAERFSSGAEQRLGDFAALVAQAIANSESRRQLETVAEEQAALRRVATLVAEGRPRAEVLEAVTREVGRLYDASAVSFVTWEGVPNEVRVVASWSDGRVPAIPAGALYQPDVGGITLRVLETGLAGRSEETSPELGSCFVIAAPVIVNARLVGALTAARPSDEVFPIGCELRLRSFADFAAQSTANEQAHEEMRASRARIMRAGDEVRQKLERNLHDGAQQRLVAVSISLRLALAKLPEVAEDARELLSAASDELGQALEELRELARGIHPSILTERGLGPALTALASRAPFEVVVDNELDERLPPQVEAAAYYVVAESLTNAAKYAEASAVTVHVCRRNEVAHVEVADDGIGGADASRGSGLRGLADRVEALDGRLSVESPTVGGTRITAELPLAR